MSLGDAYLTDVLRTLRRYKELAEGAMDQVNDADLFRELPPETNSVAIVAKHMAGNMHSRWTDFLTTDGEKPDRGRDEEFLVGEMQTRADLLERWESGWARLLETLESLGEDDLERTVTIRGERHTVLQAIQRAVTHYAYHVGQIVLLCKHFAGAEWRSLSIPRAGSPNPGR